MDRLHDLRLLEQGLKDPQLNQAQKERIRYQINVIKNEDKKIKSMREALIKAHREGNNDEINDIREWAEHHKAYRNEQRFSNQD